ncbi:type 4b pilus protein PilO2 [Pseudomonas fragariae (ex Marin et al. 2024)]|uniref:type 4b pilus protein PilO2 n=1 Tax=Pseudomonas fragariae (ex Marin et al. 2024) TaxID=3080056 RepID=UPI003F79273B
MSANSSEIQVVAINGKQFVSGLVWEPLKDKNYMREAREIGKRESMDIVAIRKGLMAQAGFVKKGNGVNKGMYSLASALAGQIKRESWIGAFLLPNAQYALVAVHNGLIVPEYDLISDRLTVMQRLKELDSQTRVMAFDSAFHPDDFNHRGSALDIEVLLKPELIRKEYALKQLTFGLTRREIIQLSVLLVIFVVLCIGYTQWQAYQEREALRIAQLMEAKRLKELEELNARAGAELTAQALEHSWADQPSIADFLGSCQTTLDGLPLSVGGWMIEAGSCTPMAVESVYQRAGTTTFNDLVHASRDRFANPPELLAGSDRARLRDDMKMGAGGDDELVAFEHLQADFMSHFQRLDLKPEINTVAVVVPPPAPMPGGETPPPPPVPDWQQFSFTLTSTYRPQDLFSDLGLRGVRLTEISVVRTGAELAWSVKGDIYAR